MRVLVCGGRDFDDRMYLRWKLDQLHYEHNFTSLIQGGARGADTEAALWAAGRHVLCFTYNADWKKHPRAAGPIRNQRMIDEGSPRLVVAFPGGKGTTDMIRRAKMAEIPVIIVSGQK